MYNYCTMVLLMSDIAQYLILSASGTVNDLNSCTIAEIVQCMVSVKRKGNFYLICFMTINLVQDLNICSTTTISGYRTLQRLVQLLMMLELY